MTPAETRILQAILAQLTVTPGCAILQSDGTLKGDPSPRAIFWRQNTGAARTADRLIRFGIVGQSDITGVAVGRRVDIEVKTDTGRQSREQRQYEAHVTSAGALYILARSVTDTIATIRGLIAC